MEQRSLRVRRAKTRLAATRTTQADSVVAPAAASVPNCSFPPWKLRDKKLLLSALREYGSHDLDALAAAVGRGPNDVRNMVTSFKTRVESEVLHSTKKQCTSEGAPIEEWRNLILRLLPYKCRQTDYSTILGELLIEAGKQYTDTERQREPNIRSTYEYLGCLLTGRRSAPELSPIDSAILLKLFQRLSRTIKFLPLEREMEMLQSWTRVESRGDPDETFHLKETISSGTNTCLEDGDSTQTPSKTKVDNRNAFVKAKMKSIIQCMNPLQLPAADPQKDAAKTLAETF